MVAGAAGAVIFLGLALYRTFADGPSAEEGLSRVVQGVAAAVLFVACLIFAAGLLRWVFQRNLSRLLETRQTPLVVDAIRNRVLTRESDSERPVPFFLSLVADESTVEVVGGLFRPAAVWSAQWGELEAVRIGTTFDGRQAYECLELVRIADQVLLPLVVTGKGLGGFGAIEGEDLQGFVDELNELRSAAISSAR